MPRRTSRAIATLFFARFGWPRVELGFASFDPGDVFHETFYSNRWYNVFEIRAAGGGLKGWYADLTRPARIAADAVDWEDLALDLWMSPDGRLSLLDEDEFAAIEPALAPAEGQAVRSAVPALRDRLRLRQRTRCPRSPPAGVHDRPLAGHLGPFPALRRGRRLRRSSLVERRRVGLARARRTRAPAAPRERRIGRLEASGVRPLAAGARGRAGDSSEPPRG